MTRQTLHPVPILSLEQVYDQTVISLLVDLPFLLGGNRGWQSLEGGFSIWGHLYGRRFGANSIEVFMQAIQEETEELLGIMLIGAREGRRIGGD